MYLIIRMINYIEDSNIKFYTKFFLLISIIPSLSIYGLKDENTIAFALICIYWLIFIISCCLFSKYKKNNNNVIKHDFYSPLFDLMFIWLIITTLFFSCKYGNFRLFVNFEDVYKYRLETAQMKTFSSYMFLINNNIILPICFNYHIKKKNIISILIDVFLFFLNYSIYGQKKYLFSMLIIIFMWIIYKIKLDKISIEIISSLLIILSMFSIIYSIINDNVLNMYIGLLYRLLYIPSEAHYYYYDFFQTHELLYLRQSAGRIFFSNPYDRDISEIIGSSIKYNVFNDYNNLSNGLFSDAYMNFGLVGIIILPILIALTLYIIDKNIKCFNAPITYSIFVILIFFVFSTQYFTWLISGGCLALIIIVKLNNFLIKTKNKV